jgi:hypothetical protein
MSPSRRISLHSGCPGGPAAYSSLGVAARTRGLKPIREQPNATPPGAVFSESVAWPVLGPFLIASATALVPVWAVPARRRGEVSCLGVCSACWRSCSARLRSTVAVITTGAASRAAGLVARHHVPRVARRPAVLRLWVRSPLASLVDPKAARGPDTTTHRKPTASPQTCRAIGALCADAVSFLSDPRSPAALEAPTETVPAPIRGAAVKCTFSESQIVAGRHFRVA